METPLRGKRRHTDRACWRWGQKTHGGVSGRGGGPLSFPSPPVESYSSAQVPGGTMGTGQHTGEATLARLQSPDWGQGGEEPY